jgi:acyl-CoA hydrolase
MTACGLEAALRSVLRRGSTVALGDGVGQLRTLQSGDAAAAVLSRLARQVGDIRLALGWLPAPLEGIEPEAFTEVVTLMPGWGSRGLLRCATAHFVPARLTAVAAVLSDVLRPDVLIIRAAERNGALHFGTEVSWQRGLIDAGVRVLAMVDTTSPAAGAGPPLNPARVGIVGHSVDGPLPMPQKTPDPVHEALADNVLRFVPEGAQLQYGPGPLGTALLNRTTVPLRIDTGLLTDAVVDLDRRGMLIGTPSATYLLGSEKLYDWADGKPILHGTEYTHDAARLARGGPFVAVNTAIEIDAFGQINVEGVGDKVVGGIGGHPDYCAAAAKIRNGLSIIAMPSRTNGNSPLVSHLSRPVSTPAYDIDLVVTELGHADLRGADWTRRRELITKLFDKESDQ